MSRMSSAKRILAEESLIKLIKYGSKLYFSSFLTSNNKVTNFYIENTKRYYRLSPHHTIDIYKYDVPIDPWKLLWVDPEKIVRFTDRDGKFWRQRHKQVGNVVSGDWDITGDEFKHHWIYTSFINRFKKNSSWIETDLYRRYQARPKRNAVNRCERYDRLFNDIKQNGYKTQIELWKNGDKISLNIVKLLTNEITIDIGRDGELLLVDGKHRLSIAKILNIDKIPIFVLTRHPNWVQKLEHDWKNNTL